MTVEELIGEIRSIEEQKIVCVEEQNELKKSLDILRGKYAGLEHKCGILHAALQAHIRTGEDLLSLVIQLKGNENV